MWVIDEVLTMLKDGNWHALNQIAKKCSTNELRLKMITGFLSKYDFIELDEKGRKARLRPLMLEFISEIQRIGTEEAVKP